MNKKEVTLQLHDQNYSIISEIHSRDSLKEYQLDPIDFYEKWGGEKPGEMGYEVEILNYEEVNKLHKKMNKSLDSNGKLVPLNLHQGKDGKMYMCYTKHLEFISESESVYKNWAKIVFCQIFLGLTFDDLGEAIKSTCFWKRGDYAEQQLNINGFKFI